MMHRHCTELVIVVVCLAALSAAFQSTKSVDKSAEHLQRHQHTDAVHKKRFDEKEPLKPSSDSDTYDDEADGDGEAADANVGSDGSEENPSLPLPGTYIPSNCSTCARREELRRRSLEVIKDQILNKLGMQQAPNITGRLPPRIPPLDHLLDMYGMQGDAPGGPFQAGPVYDEEEDDFHARTEKVIAFAQQLPHVRQALKRTESGATRGMESMYFKFSDKVMRSSKVDKAHLWLYLQHNGHSSHHNHHNHHHRSHGKHHSNATVWIHIYKVVRVPEGESPILNPVRATRVALPTPEEVKSGKSSGGWVSIELRKVVYDWFRWPEENFGLVVQAVLGDGSSPAANGKQPIVSSGLPSPFTIVTDPSHADGSLVPFVEVVTTDGRKQRTKRTIGLNCDETSSETRCCRYPLTVDFVEFGWDWIIAPKKYEANYCSGECPYVFLQKYPHTHIVQQANPAGTAGPCCAPRKMSSISMLYFDNEFNIIYGNLPGMVVDRCGCS